MMREKRTRILMALAGVCICGASVGLFQVSVFGMDPFQCLAHGLNNVVPVGFGTLYMCLNLLMFVGVCIVDRHFIGVATFLNMFGLGYIVELTVFCLQKWAPHPGLAMRAVLLVLGIVIMCFSSSLYFTADMGVSVYDSIALIMTKRGLAKFQVCRVGCDLFCVAAGVLLHAVVGVGTVVTAFFMGPLIEYFNVHFSRPFLSRHS